MNLFAIGLHLWEMVSETAKPANLVQKYSLGPNAIADSACSRKRVQQLQKRFFGF